MIYHFITIVFLTMLFSCSSIKKTGTQFGVPLYPKHSLNKDINGFKIDKNFSLNLDSFSDEYTNAFLYYASKDLGVAKKVNLAKRIDEQELNSPEATSLFLSGFTDRSPVLFLTLESSEKRHSRISIFYPSRPGIFEDINQKLGTGFSRHHCSGRNFLRSVVDSEISTDLLLENKNCRLRVWRKGKEVALLFYHYKPDRSFSFIHLSIIDLDLYKNSYFHEALKELEIPLMIGYIRGNK